MVLMLDGIKIYKGSIGDLEEVKLADCMPKPKHDAPPVY